MPDRFSLLFAAHGAEVRELVARLKRLGVEREALRESVGRLADEERRFQENHGPSLSEGQAALTALIARQGRLRQDLDAARAEMKVLRAKTRNFFAVLSSTLSSLVEIDGLRVSEMRKRIVVLERNEDAWDAALGEVTIARAEQEKQLATQGAPLESIRYALVHLRATLKDLKRRRRALARRLIRLVKEHVQFTPLSIWRHRCSGRDDGEALFARILALRKKLRMAACLKAADRELAPEQGPLDPPYYASVARQDLQIARFPAHGRIAMRGKGSYHKKEYYRNAKGHRRTRWNRREIIFDDSLGLDFHIQSRCWRPQAVAGAMRAGAANALARGYRGRNKRRLRRRWRACQKAIRRETLGLLSSLQPAVFKKPADVPPAAPAPASPVPAQTEAG